jgi:hypothetical protein
VVNDSGRGWPGRRRGAVDVIVVVVVDNVDKVIVSVIRAWGLEVGE